MATTALRSGKAWLARNFPFYLNEACRARNGRWDKTQKRWYFPAGSLPLRFEKWAVQAYLYCPESDWRKCAELGGMWDDKERRWYVPWDKETDAFSPWIGCRQTPARYAQCPQRKRRSHANRKIYLASSFPFQLKEWCKACGGQWDNPKGRWYFQGESFPCQFDKWAERIYLACPESDWEKCSALGGKWDHEEKKFYVPVHKQTSDFECWIEAATPGKASQCSRRLIQPVASAQRSSRKRLPNTTGRRDKQQRRRVSTARMGRPCRGAAESGGRGRTELYRQDGEGRWDSCGVGRQGADRAVQAGREARSGSYRVGRQGADRAVPRPNIR